MIRFLLDDPVYRATYRRHLEELASTVFDPDRVTARLRAEQALIAPYVVGMDGEQPGRTFLTSSAQFESSVASLTAYVQTRSAAVKQALAVIR